MCKVTILSSAIMSWIIAIVIILLIDQVVPCDHSDNRHSVEGWLIFVYVTLIFAVIYIFYMGLKDKDYTAIAVTDRNMVIC